jgi:hypothetical protein
MDSASWIIPKRKTHTDDLNKQRKDKARKTYKILLETFDESELRELLFDFDLQWDDLDGDTLKEKKQALVMYMYRHHQLEVFIHWLSGLRPDEDWPSTVLDSEE